MIPAPPQKEYTPVDWHGKCLHIDQDKEGFITISHPPFETIFNAEEGEEIKQFITKYLPAPSPTDKKILKELEWTKEHESILMQRIIQMEKEIATIRNATRKGLLDELYLLAEDMISDGQRMIREEPTGKLYGKGKVVAAFVFQMRIESLRTQITQESKP